MNVALKYNPSVHAVERIREYFGIMEENAKHFINQLMHKAEYVTTQSDGKLVYKHAGKDAMIVVSPETRTIVTVLPPHGKGKHNVGQAKIGVDTTILQPIFEREQRKLQREVTRNTRALELTKAKALLQYGEHAVNKANARNPKTQALIQAKMDDIMTQVNVIDAAIKREQDRLEAFTKATGVFV